MPPGFRTRDELETIFSNIEDMPAELGIAAHAGIDRLRPYPYDATESITLTDGGAPDTFPANYTEIVPRGTYDFGDSPNYLRIEYVGFENLSANDIYVVEFYASEDGVEFDPLSAIRVVRTAVFARSFYIRVPVRPLNIDDYGLYGRVKTASGGGNSVTLCVIIGRYLLPAAPVELSPGVWPFG